MPSTFYDPLRLLRELKGAPLAVLVAFSLTRTTLSADFLVTQTGYTDKPVTTALKLLSSRGWLVKCLGGWRIAEGVQLPLGLGESEKFRLSSSSSLISGPTSCQEEEEEDRKNSDSFYANYRALKGYGIREPALTRLAAAEWVTPEYIHAHVRRARLDKGTLGTAIFRMDKEWELPIIEDETPVVSHRYSDSVWLHPGSIYSQEQECEK